MDYFNNRRQALKDEFKGHARQLSEYEAFNDRSAKELWKMLSVIPIMTTVANDEQKSETVRIAVITLHHRIDVDMRREVEAYQHSLDEALRASVDSILYEKAEHVPKYNLQIQLQVEEKSYPKEIYYTDFDQWKLLFTNLLRNAVEATVSAAEETSAIVQERRVVVATLEEEYGRELRQIIEIEDHGCGMDERTRANMFRSGFTYGKREGTGHGLTPELERFILAHGRYIVRTAKNVGTTIRIEVERV